MSQRYQALMTTERLPETGRSFIGVDAHPERAIDSMAILARCFGRLLADVAPIAIFVACNGPHYQCRRRTDHVMTLRGLAARGRSC